MTPLSHLNVARLNKLWDCVHSLVFTPRYGSEYLEMTVLEEGGYVERCHWCEEHGASNHLAHRKAIVIGRHPNPWAELAEQVVHWKVTIPGLRALGASSR